MLRIFDLSQGTLSPEPVAYGRIGEVWRLDCAEGSWAVKTEANAMSEAGLAPSVRFHEAAVAAGLPAPSVRRTVDDRVVGRIGPHEVRVQSWVDMAGADPLLDPAAVGRLLAGLHGLPRMTGDDGAVDPWFVTPVGAPAWDSLVERALAAGAPFAPDLAAHRDELVALEALLSPPRDLRWCHRDLFADNVRAVPDGGLVVFDFDNSGPSDPAWELAHVLVEFATEPERAQALVEAYTEAGGPARLTGPHDFTMVIAMLGHIAEIATERWLATDDPAQRDDLAAWAAELTDRPLTREVVADLLDAVVD
jgi:Ser/Thr protein kinase RdoA (MazF antagonist)